MTALRDWFHLVTDITERGLSRTRAATEEERVELARELDILSCDSLNVAYEIKLRGNARYVLEGTLEADVTQACVVSLEPVAARVEEKFEVELGSAEDLVEDPVEDDVEVSSVPDIEPIENDRIEVGVILFGVLSAALPPYPRKPGVEFDWVDPKAETDPSAASPFAALAKLKPQS